MKMINIKKIVLFLLIVSISVACAPKEPKETNEKMMTQSEILVQYGKITEQIETNAIPREEIQTFITKVLQYVQETPEDVNAPDFLFKAGVLSITLAKTAVTPEQKAHSANQALDIFSKLERIYPENENIKPSILNRAFLYDDVLQDYNSAKTIYSDYIHRYPNDSVSLHLKTYIETLGKTPEELMEEIRKKEQK